MAKLEEGLGIKYVPIFPQAPVDMKFHYYEEQEDGTKVLRIKDDGDYKLITDLEDLKEFAKKCKDQKIAFDTETTGLTYGEDKIVGFSVSVDEYSGIYVPIRHKVRTGIIEEVQKKDKEGNLVFLKSGKPAMKKVTTYKLDESEYNLDPKATLDVLYDLLVSAKVVYMYNSEFDLNMLKFEGYDVTKIKAFDVLILPYIYDPEASGQSGLKDLEKRVLGRTVPEFKDVLGKDCENFSLVSPERGYHYACFDTAGTLGVFNKMYPEVQKLLSMHKKFIILDGKPYKVLASDNKLVMAFVDYYGHAKILIDKEKAIKYREQLLEKQKEVIKEIYTYFDAGMFNLSTSSKEFKEVMASKNVFTGVKTDKGGHSWSSKAAVEYKRNIDRLKSCIEEWKKIEFKDGRLPRTGKGLELARILEIYGGYYFKIKATKPSLNIKGLKNEPVGLVDFWLTVKKMYQTEKEKLRILGLIHKNNSLNKALNSYVDKLTQVEECRMRYRLKGTKSGRLSSGNGSKSDKRKNHYYIDLNAQNLTKPASGYYRAEPCSRDDEEGVLGWKFTAVSKDYAKDHLEDEFIVEGQDPGITIRGCLKAPKGRYVVSMDYDAQEYKVLCCISGETVMKEAFLAGIDPHTATAYGIWGKENYDKIKRKKAKVVNFLVAYEGGANTLAEGLDIPIEQAQDILTKYELNYPTATAWKQQSKDEMYANGGVVFSAFGRPRSFRGWLNIMAEASDNYSSLVEKERIDKACRGVKKAIERRTVNHKIQSTCGDILRHVLLKLYDTYFKNRDPHIDFMSTVHDEVNYTIDKEYVEKYVAELEDIMTFSALDPELPILTSVDVGYSYGNMFPFVWENDEKRKLIPKRISSM